MPRFSKRGRDDASPPRELSVDEERLLRAAARLQGDAASQDIAALVQGFISYPFHDPVLTDRSFLSTPRTMFAAFLAGGALSFTFIVLFSGVGIADCYLENDGYQDGDTLPPGFVASSLATIGQGRPAPMRGSRTIGVFPMRSSTDPATSRPLMSMGPSWYYSDRTWQPGARNPY